MSTLPIPRQQATVETADSRLFFYEAENVEQDSNQVMFGLSKDLADNAELIPTGSLAINPGLDPSASIATGPIDRKSQISWNWTLGFKSEERADYLVCEVKWAEQPTDLSVAWHHLSPYHQGKFRRQGFIEDSEKLLAGFVERAVAAAGLAKATRYLKAKRIEAQNLCDEPSYFSTQSVPYNIVGFIGGMGLKNPALAISTGGENTMDSQHLPPYILSILSRSDLSFSAQAKILDPVDKFKTITVDPSELKLVSA